MNTITFKHLGRALLASLCLTVSNAAEKPGSPKTPPSAQTVVRNVNPAEAEKLIAGKQLVVLDIRTPEEFQAGHIAGATNINFRAPDFAKQIAALPKGKTYLLHCASGNRSTQSLPVFKKLEFSSLYHLDGGMKAWKKAGLPVTK